MPSAGLWKPTMAAMKSALAVAVQTLALLRSVVTPKTRAVSAQASFQRSDSQ